MAKGTDSKDREEIQQGSPLIMRQLAETARRSGAFAIMRQNGFGKRRGPAIVQKPGAQAKTPQRRSSPFGAGGIALNDPVIERGSHVVQQQIRIQRNLATPG